MGNRHFWMPAAVAALIMTSAAVAVTGCAATPAATSTDSELNTLAERPDRKIVELDNGLVIIAQRIPTAPVASVQCWVETGSIYEREHNGAGLSHFLEHLVSGGSTSNRTEAESNRILGEIGARMNAATGLDTVRYHINTSAEHAPVAVDLLSDWMQNSTIPRDEYERERDVIQRELGMGRGDPARIFWRLTQQARYTTHPARHPTIGYLDEFLEVSRDEIYDFYRAMYVPNNMVFVVTGDIDPAATVEQVAGLWSGAERKRLPAIVFPDEGEIDQPREMTGEADIDRPRLRLAWPGTRLAAEHDYELDLLAYILGEGELSRLVRTVRDEQGLATSIEAFNASFSWGEGFFGVDAVVDRDRADEARDAILAEVDRLGVIGITEEELDRAKRKTVAEVVMHVQTAEAAAGRMAGDFIHTGDPDYLQRYADAIERVELADVRAAARRFLRPERLITVRLLPREGEPEEPTRPADDPDARPLRPRDGELVYLDNDRLVERFRAIEREDPADVAAPELGPIRMHTLDNGLRVILQRDTRLPIVAMDWYHLGGLMADEPGREGVANAAARMLLRGAGDRSAQDIARELEDIGARLSTNCGNSTIYVTGRSLSEDWPTVLDLLADVIQRPTFPEDEWDLMRPRLLAEIASQNDQWHARLRNTLRAAYFGDDHPWSQPTVGRRQVVEDLTPDQMRRFHADHIGAADGAVAIFGDIDEAEVLSRVESLFGDMPAEPPVPFEPREPAPIDTRIAQVSTTSPLAAMQIAYAPGLARDNPDYAPMLVMNRVLDSFPVGWLAQALRGEGEGLVYAVGSGLMTGVAPGYWAVLFNTQPDTLPQAMERALEVVERIRTEPVDDATLNRARTGVLVSESFSRQTIGQRASDAALNELYGVGYDQGEALIEQIRAVDAAEVQRVARQYIDQPVAAILSSEPIDEEQLPPLRRPAEVE